MTMHPFSRRSARPSALRATLLPAHGTACVLLAAWLLTACGSTPLPPWPATPTAPRSAEQPAASRPQARPAPTGPAAVGRPLPDHAPLGGPPPARARPVGGARRRPGGRASRAAIRTTRVTPLWRRRRRPVPGATEGLQHTRAAPRAPPIHHQTRTGPVAVRPGPER